MNGSQSASDATASPRAPVRSPHLPSTGLSTTNNNNGSVHSAPPSAASAAGFKDFNPGNFPPGHESRRRNAEQREAALRADPLLREVEPNRVFCNLCLKWVQLRQDSSFCAYPWHQHRGKCLARQ